MKIKRVKPNNRKKYFEVTTYNKTYFFPYVKLDIQPSPKNKIENVYVDRELNNEAFTYVLASNDEGTVHIDYVLEYNQDPGYLSDLLLYKLTLEAQKRVDSSPLNKRELIRRFGTSATQFYGLLDQTNYKKSLGQLLSLLHVLDCDVDLVVKERVPKSAYLGPSGESANRSAEILRYSGDIIGMKRQRDQTKENTMPTVKRIVCLANSRKLSGRCIAGKEWDGSRSGAWIRPISDRQNEEVSEYERQYEDGSDPQVLDIIAVPLLSQKNRQDHQRENWLLEAGYYWTKHGVFSPKKLRQLVDPVAPLWLNGYKTYHGENDQVPIERVGSLTYSIRLIQVDDLHLSVFVTPDAYGNARRRRVQGRFTHDGEPYALWVTDPVCERNYLQRPDGQYEIGESYLTISLGEPFNNACYKLIAAVIHPDKVSP